MKRQILLSTNPDRWCFVSIINYAPGITLIPTLRLDKWPHQVAFSLVWLSWKISLSRILRRP